MVSKYLTMLERSVMEESHWKPVGDLASTILQAATERREKLLAWKADVARNQGAALASSSKGIWVQLELPFPQAPAPTPAPAYRVSRGGRSFRL